MFDAYLTYMTHTYTISYTNLAQITDLAQFVRLFQHCLSFDDYGVTMRRES